MKLHILGGRWSCNGEHPKSDLHVSLGTGGYQKYLPVLLEELMPCCWTKLLKTFG